MRAAIHSNVAMAAAAPIVFMSPIRLPAAILLYYWHLANALSAYSMNTITLRLIACLGCSRKASPTVDKPAIGSIFICL